MGVLSQADVPGRATTRHGCGHDRLLESRHAVAWPVALDPWRPVPEVCLLCLSLNRPHRSLISSAGCFLTLGLRLPGREAITSRRPFVPMAHDMAAATPLSSRVFPQAVPFNAPLDSPFNSPPPTVSGQSRGQYRGELSGERREKQPWQDERPGEAMSGSWEGRAAGTPRPCRGVASWPSARLHNAFWPIHRRGLGAPGPNEGRLSPLAPRRPLDAGAVGHSPRCAVPAIARGRKP